MSTNLGFAGRLFAAPSGRVLSFGGTVTPPVVLPTPNPPVITNEDDAAQTLTFSVPGGLSYDQVRYEVAGAGPYTPTSFTIQLSPSVSYLPGAVVLYVVGIDGVRTDSLRVANLTTLAAAAPSNTTPAAPVLAADDAADTLTITSAFALSELEMRTTDNQTVRAVPSLVIAQGDVDRAAGFTQVRVRAAAGRNASQWTDSPAFTKKPSGIDKTRFRFFGLSKTAGNTDAQWNDESGGNRHLTQPDAGRRMILEDGIYYGGGNAGWLAPTFTSIANDFTIYAVLLLTNETLRFLDNNSGQRLLLSFNEAGITYSSDTSWQGPTPHPPLNTKCVFCWRLNRNAGPSLRINGQLFGSGGAYLPVALLAGTTVLTSNDWYGALRGQALAFALAIGVDTDAKVLETETYLAAQCGVTY